MLVYLILVTWLKGFDDKIKMYVILILTLYFRNEFITYTHPVGDANTQWVSKVNGFRTKQRL